MIQLCTSPTTPCQRSLQSLWSSLQADQVSILDPDQLVALARYELHWRRHRCVVCAPSRSNDIILASCLLDRETRTLPTSPPRTTKWRTDNRKVFRVPISRTTAASVADGDGSRMDRQKASLRGPTTKGPKTKKTQTRVYPIFVPTSWPSATSHPPLRNQKLRT